MSKHHIPDDKVRIEYNLDGIRAKKISQQINTGKTLSDKKLNFFLDWSFNAGNDTPNSKEDTQTKLKIIETLISNTPHAKTQYSIYKTLLKRLNQYSPFGINKPLKNAIANKAANLIPALNKKPKSMITEYIFLLKHTEPKSAERKKVLDSIKSTITRTCPTPKKEYLLREFYAGKLNDLKSKYNLDDAQNLNQNRINTILRYNSLSKRGENSFTYDL